MRRLAFAGILILISTSLTMADTYVEGDIEGGFWGIGGSPYILEDDITLLSGCTLEIEPGVIVRGDYLSTFYVEGELIAHGTPGKWIVFTELFNGEGWGGFIIEYNDNLTSMEYCIVEYGRVIEHPIHGGGFNIKHSPIRLDHCIVRYNHAPYDGGGIYLYYADFEITNTLFHHNTCDRCGSSVDFAGGSGGIFEHNVIAYSTAGAGGAIYFYAGYHELDHITMYGNSALQNGMGSEGYLYMGTGEFRNSIIWNDEEDSPLFNGLPMSASYSCMSDYTASGENNIFYDPLFIDREAMNFYLMPESPCINMGDPESDPDPDGSRTDMGAFWCQDGIPPDEFPLELEVYDATSQQGELIFIPVVLKGIHLQHDIREITCEVVLPTEIIEDVDRIEMSLNNPQNWTFDAVYINGSVFVQMEGGNPLGSTTPLFTIHAFIDDNSDLGTYPVLVDTVIVNNGNLEVDTILDGRINVLDDELVLGDVDLDRVVDDMDAQMLFDYFSGEVELNDIQLVLAEVSGNHFLNPFDVALIMQYHAGIIDEYPVETGIPDLSGRGRVLYNSGEVDANYHSEIPLQFRNASEVNAVRVVYEYNPNIVVLSDEVMNLPVAISNLYYVETGAVVEYASSIDYEGDPLELGTLLFELLDEDREQATVTITEFHVNDWVISHPGEFYIYNNTGADPGEMPLEYELITAYPNPFNPSTTIRLALESPGQSQLRIVNTLGRTVQVFENGYLSAGIHQYTWNATGLATGVYYIHANCLNQSQTMKIIYLR